MINNRIVYTIMHPRFCKILLKSKIVMIYPRAFHEFGESLLLLRSIFVEIFYLSVIKIQYCHFLRTTFLDRRSIAPQTYA